MRISITTKRQERKERERQYRAKVCELEQALSFKEEQHRQALKELKTAGELLNYWYEEEGAWVITKPGERPIEVAEHPEGLGQTAELVDAVRWALKWITTHTDHARFILEDALAGRPWRTRNFQDSEEDAEAEKGE